MTISQSLIWQSLQTHAKTIPSIKDLFKADAQRFEHFSASFAGASILLDYSKQRVDAAAITQLLTLAKQQNVEQLRDAMFAGEAINNTENRSVLHSALRLPKDAKEFVVEGEEVVSGVHKVLAQMRRFTEEVRSGRAVGYTGKPIRSVVNIGIGGSDLGPQMATIAMSPWAHPDLTMHFVSNVDGRHIADTLKLVDPETTLFVIGSKTFTTLETITNAKTARQWALDQGVPEAQLSKHFVALSTNIPAAVAFGVAEENIFPFANWVGGRYSLWSAIGLSIALSIGMDRFEELLAGAHEMDQHFINTPLEKNLPVLMALVGIWNLNFLGYNALSIAPYHQRLNRLAAYLQQLEMESNGKSVARDGSRVDYATCAILFGEAGTNGQHAYFQLLHQGTSIVPVDFIVAAEDDTRLPAHNNALLANCFAQSKAMAMGKTLEEVQAELPNLALELQTPRVFKGNRPTTTVLIDALTPRTLGALIALYEHKVFVQAAVWNINAFDQWGVELGKTLAQQIISLDPDAVKDGFDSSTKGLLKAVASLKA
jgi:glucose-6-phosphate isomerase